MVNPSLMGGCSLTGGKAGEVGQELVRSLDCPKNWLQGFTNPHGRRRVLSHQPLAMQVLVG